MVTVDDTAQYVNTVLKDKVDKANVALIHHCIRIANVAKYSYVDHYNYATVALLHEVIEDGNVTLSELSARYDYAVVAAVDAISKRSNESYMTYIKRCATNKIACLVKLVDLKDNMDITRLQKLSKADFSRLAKYHKAYKYLHKYAIQHYDIDDID